MRDEGLDVSAGHQSNRDVVGWNFDWAEEVERLIEQFATDAFKPITFTLVLLAVDHVDRLIGAQCLIKLT